MNDTTVWCQNPSVTEPRRDGGGEADGEGSTVRKEPSHPLSRELSQRESLWMRSFFFRGIGFARSRRCLQHCNTKAKPAIKGVKYMKKAIWIIISIILAIIIVMDVFLFICGSLEAFPTVEQIEKGRIVYGLFLGIFVIVEAFVLTRVIKNK